MFGASAGDDSRRNPAERPTRIRVLIADLPMLLRDLVHATIAAQPDMEVVGNAPAAHAEHGDTGLAPWATLMPDVAVIGVPTAELPAPWGELLYEHPRLCVLAVVGDGRRAWLHELRPATTDLGEPAPDLLLDVIRRVGAQARTEAHGDH